LRRSDHERLAAHPWLTLYVYVFNDLGIELCVMGNAVTDQLHGYHFRLNEKRIRSSQRGSQATKVGKTKLQPSHPRPKSVSFCGLHFPCTWSRRSSDVCLSIQTPPFSRRITTLRSLCSPYILCAFMSGIIVPKADGANQQHRQGYLPEIKESARY
jgi:hypothetical protein